MKKFEQRSEDRKLAMWTQGKWGGVVFVPGGLLVQGDQFKKVGSDANMFESPAEGQDVLSGTKAAEKAAKALRKAERRERREARARKKAQDKTTESKSAVGNGVVKEVNEGAERKQSSYNEKRTTTSTVVLDIESAHSTDQKPKKRKRSKEKYKRQSDTAKIMVKSAREDKAVMETVQLPTPPSEGLELPIVAQTLQSRPRNGRHLLRGRNIQAKRMAFTDSKMLDEVRGRILPIFAERKANEQQIFMRKP